jgi:hypothetical protein
MAHPDKTPAKGPILRPIYRKNEPATVCLFASDEIFRPTNKIAIVAMKNEAHAPTPASCATTVILMAGVIVGAILATD